MIKQQINKSLFLFPTTSSSQIITIIILLFFKRKLETKKSNYLKKNKAINHKQSNKLLALKQKLNAKNFNNITRPTESTNKYALLLKKFRI